MKKQFLAAGFAVVTALTASAQTKEDNVPPPSPPPSVERPPAPPNAPMPPIEGVEMQGNLDEFLKRNPDVKSVEWTRDDEIIIQLKNGKQEKYNLKNDKSIGSAEAKYGKLPMIPPPPPPVPAPPPPPKRSHTLS